MKCGFEKEIRLGESRLFLRRGPNPRPARGVRLKAAIGIMYDLQEAVGEAPTATREGAYGPQVKEFVALDEDLGVD